MLAGSPTGIKGQVPAVPPTPRNVIPGVQVHYYVVARATVIDRATCLTGS